MKAVLLAALAGFLSSVAAFAQTPPPSQAEGYKLVFADDFSHFDLAPGGNGAHVWYPGIYFDKTQPSPNAITVANSALDLTWDRSSGQKDTSIEGCAHDGSHCTTFRYGYFEARMKWDVTNGAWPAFWMITRQSILGVQHVGEIDIFEGQGNDPTHYYGTINEWNGGNDLVSTNSPAGNRFALPATNNFSEWHTYGVLWVPGRVTWYFDDKPVGTASTPAIFDQQDFFLILGSQEGNHWQWGNLTDVTAQSINLNVEWVRVYQDPNPSQAETPSIVTATLPAPNSALPYAVAPIVRGGSAPYTFSVSAGALPKGLQLNAADGMISNVPGEVLAAGPYRFTLQVTDAAGSTATATYSGNVSAAPVMPVFTSYALPAASGANGITAGPDGALWFTTPDQAGGNLIGRITMAGTITTTESRNALTQTNFQNFELATGGDIAAGPNGTLWIAQRDGNAIGSLSVDGSSPQLTHLPPTAHSGPSQIAAAPDGTLWFTESVASKIAHIEANGTVREFPTPAAAGSPAAIAFAPDGAVVFTEPRANGIGFLSKDGAASFDFPIPTPNSLPTSIVLGPDNAFWFTEWGANKIGRIDFAGNIQEVPVSSAPQAITVGPDLALYFTENSANKIGRITILGQVTEISIPEANSGPIGITSGPDGAIWFTEDNLSKIGRLTFLPAQSVTADQPQAPHQAGYSASRLRHRKLR